MDRQEFTRRVLTNRGAAMVIDFTLCEDDGSELPSDSGYGRDERTEDGVRLFRQVTDLQTLAQTPETLLLAPRVIGADEHLPAVSCRLVG